jgi:hypothetical protein
MSSFLIEVFDPGFEADGLARIVERAREAAASLDTATAPVRHLHSYLIPGDEMSFHLFEAPSVEVVRQVAILASIRTDRISEVLG